MTEEINRIKKKIKKVLDKERYQHTLGVAYTACSMAMRYGENPDRLFLAGILHDCAKNIPNQEKYALCKKYKISLNETEKIAPYLLHSKLGAYLAEHTYGIKDMEVLNAVRYHTTGRPGMSRIEKIIFTADYIEPNRKNAPNLPEVRRLAFTDLDEAVVKILDDTLEYLESGSRPIDPMTRMTYEFYLDYLD
ncbi:MAG: bis(5'-nucleosyl)-tetraphosphatase (symmetrical) YqeK [Lachnospiraceae bacterium]|nr:bis(5'-nucleosyl)-tetraphosphatase (symmetrical) YqeK [Lachnospiraceae bacterium]